MRRSGGVRVRDGRRRRGRVVSVIEAETGEREWGRKGTGNGWSDVTYSGCVLDSPMTNPQVCKKTAQENHVHN